EVDVRDDADLPRDDVRRVEAAAEAALDDGPLDFGLGEDLESRRGDEGEPGRRSSGRPLPERSPAGVEAALQRGRGLLVPDVRAVDADALVDAVDVRRGVEAGSHARVRERRRDERAGRALPLGPRDVDGAETGVRGAEALEDVGGGLESAAHGG